MKANPKLPQFAKEAGVELTTCGPDWGGGRIAYKEADRPNVSYCGFRTENAAYMHWLEGTFGKQTAKAVLSLLKKVPE